MIEKEDVGFIYEVCDSRYRKADDCNEIMSQTDKRQDKLEKAFVASNTKLNILISILSLLAGAAIPACINSIFGG